MANKDDIEEATSKAITFIKYRPRSEKEVRDRLALKGFSKNVIEQVITGLKQYDLINDVSFAKLWAEDRAQSKKIGRYRLIMELRQKGIEDSLIEETVNDIYERYPEEELAEALLLNKFRDRIIYTEEKKMIDFLVRKGYNYRIAKEIVRRQKTETE